MSSDDGWLIRQNSKGEYVLQNYSASVGAPDVVKGTLRFKTLDQAVRAYTGLEDNEYPSEYGLSVLLSKTKTESETMNVEQFMRKSFPVEAVRVTEENMEAVAEWCTGSIRQEASFSADNPGNSYIKVRVDNPLNERQTKAFAGDWVLYAGKGYKVYKDSAFRKSFDRSQNPGADEFAQNVFQENESGADLSQGSAGSNPGGMHVVGE